MKRRQTRCVISPSWPVARSVSQLPPVLWIKSFHGSECTRTLAHTHLLASPPSICVDLHFHFTRVTVLLSALLRQRSDMCQFYQVTGDGGDGGDRLPVGRRPSETGSQRQDLRQRSSLFTFMSCWLATLPRPTRCQSMSAEAHCGLERHQNIIVEPGCWVAAQEIRRNIFLHSHGGVFVSVCVCVSVKVSPFRQRGVRAELLFVWTLDYCCEGWEIRYLGGDEWN